MKNTLLVLAALAFGSVTFASDHIDGPVTTQHRIGDLVDLYAFPTPGKAGSLSVILNTYPIVPDGGHFSEKVSYNFYLRRAQIRVAGQPVGFDTSDEVTISCSFVTPDNVAAHVATCKTSNGKMASAKFNSIQKARVGDDFRLFTGMRLDPFFFDFAFALALGEKGKYPSVPFRLNVMHDINCLSIVMDIEVSKIFGDNPPSMIALAAQAVTDGGARQLDRVGRPEITNVSMIKRDGVELRDIFNLDRPFEVTPLNQSQYQERLFRNIGHYDRVDGAVNWFEEARQPLAAVLADDFLVVDISKPCEAEGFLEIEKSILQGKRHKTCGGRKPVDDIMDVLFTLYVGGYDSKRVGDEIGVVDYTARMAKEYPYLSGPALGPLALVWQAASRVIAKVRD